MYIHYKRNFTNLMIVPKKIANEIFKKTWFVEYDSIKITPHTYTYL